MYIFLNSNVNSNSLLGKHVDVDPTNPQVQPYASCSHVDFSSIKYMTPSTTTSPSIHPRTDVGDGGIIIDQSGKATGGNLGPIAETAESLTIESPPEGQGSLIPLKQILMSLKG